MSTHLVLCSGEPLLRHADVPGSNPGRTLYSKHTISDWQQLTYEKMLERGLFLKGPFSDLNRMYHIHDPFSLHKWKNRIKVSFVILT